MQVVQKLAIAAKKAFAAMGFSLRSLTNPRQTDGFSPALPCDPSSRRSASSAAYGKMEDQAVLAANAEKIRAALA